MKVFVVGYEPKGKESVSFFEWYYLEQDAIDKEKKYRTEQKQTPEHWEGIIYSGTIEAVPEGLSRDEITEFVDSFLDENDWENSFKS